MQEMRLWANGNVQKLLERSSMQDPRVYQALLKAIAICSHHSRPLRLLPSLAIIKQSYAVRLQTLSSFLSVLTVAPFQWMKRKQLQDAKEAQSLVSELHLIHKERVEMSREDHRVQFGKYYQRVLHEFELKLEKERLVREKRELEEARVRKIREETRNLIES